VELKFDVANPRWAALLGGVAGLGVGVLAGVLVGNRRSRNEFDQELAELKSHYNDHIKAAVASVRNEYAAVVITTELTGADEDGGPEGVVADLDRTDENGGPADGTVPEPGRLPPPRPVVIRPGNGEGREAAVASAAERDESKPFVISHDEYYDDEPGYQKLAITYYTEDDVLADDKDAPLPNWMEVAGPFKSRFGEASGDPLVVFVRNKRLEVDFEISKDLRSFAQVVLGYGNPSAAKKFVRKPRE
jgi:hypothetical protein